MRKTFHEELHALRDEVIRMGEVTTDAIHRAIKALQDGDVEAAQKVVEGDDEIDNLYLDIEEQCLSVIARQSPVARDLRLIHSVMFIAVHLERMGDLAVNIAKTARRTASQSGPDPLMDIMDRMGGVAIEIVRASMDAFARKDVELAEKLPEMDEPLDQGYKEFLKALLSYEDEESLEWAMSMVLASRYIERIADHAVDIGERVAYLVTGELREFNLVEE